MAAGQFSHRPAVRAVAGGVTLAVFLAVASPAAAQSCLCGSPADLAVAAAAGLEREWIVQVPFDSAGWRLEHVVVGESLVVAQAGDGTVAGIVTAAQPGAPRPGSVTWETHAGRSGGPIAPAGIGSDLVTVVTGSSLQALDARDGRLVWERKLRTVASAGAVPSGGWVYAPLDGGGIARYPENPWADPSRAEPQSDESPENREGVDPGRGPAEASFGPRAGELLDPITIDSGGEVDVSPLPYAGGIAWVNNAGGVAAVLRLPGVANRMDADLGQQVSGPPVAFSGDLIVASQAGDVLRLARLPRGWVASSGTMQVRVGEDRGDVEEVAFNGWYTPLNERPEGGPLVGRGTVVLSLGPAGMVALAARTGEELWRVGDPGRPLAIVGNRVWCHDTSGFLTARDLATGSRRERLCPGCFTLPVVNTVSEQLVLASPGGLVVSLAARQTRAAEPPLPMPPPSSGPDR